MIVRTKVEIIPSEYLGVSQPDVIGICNHPSRPVGDPDSMRVVLVWRRKIGPLCRNREVEPVERIRSLPHVSSPPRSARIISWCVRPSIVDATWIFNTDSAAVDPVTVWHVSHLPSTIDHGGCGQSAYEILSFCAERSSAHYPCIFWSIPKNAHIWNGV